MRTTAGQEKDDEQRKIPAAAWLAVARAWRRARPGLREARAAAIASSHHPDVTRSRGNGVCVGGLSAHALR